MNVKMLKETMEGLKTDLDGALVSSDIWQTGTGTALVSYEGNAQATALFEKVTQDINKALKGAEFPVINDYYLLNLANDMIVVVLQTVEGYEWTMLVDGKKVNLGLLLNVAVPNALKALKEAVND